MLRDDVRQLAAEHGRGATVAAIRAAVAELRALRDPCVLGPLTAADWVVRRATAGVERTPRRLRRVVNGTGVVIHTNLGRAPLGVAAARRAAELAAGYSNLELDLVSGRRGDRQDLLSELLCSLSGAEGALVVNNGAAAVLLGLAALCRGHEVVVSRGEAIEIGGGFRIPDILRLSGARLREVGTTNRTRPSDYEDACGPRTAAWLRVHQSNFRMEGFVERPSVRELARAAHQRRLLLLEDVGSGLIPAAEVATQPEDRLLASVKAGVDLLFCSGDKLVGASQAGIICGRADLVARLRRHPLARALRPDKLQLAALEETLLCYQSPDRLREIPVWRMLHQDDAALEARARRWAAVLARAGVAAEVVGLKGAVGGGTTPGHPLDSHGLLIPARNPAALRRRLLAGDPPILTLEQDRGVAIDARCVLPDEQSGMLRALVAALGSTR